MVAKVPKRGGIVILGIINGIVWYVLGMHWAMDLGYVVMGIIAEIVAGAKSYRNIKWNIASFLYSALGLPVYFWLISPILLRGLKQC